MKQAILVLAIIGSFCFSGKISNAQGPDWLWARSAGWKDDEAKSVTIDASGNIYVAGKFTSNSITFGSVSFRNFCWSSMFFVKYDADGNVLWARSTGENTYDEAKSIAVDASGNIYIAGDFNYSTEGPTVRVTDRYPSLFLSKYDAKGEVLWRKNVLGTNSIEMSSIALDATGNIYIAGKFNSPTITFGSTSLKNADKAGYTQDLFLAKYDANGNVLWAKSAGGMNDDWATSVATDATGNIYVGGSFNIDTVTTVSSILTTNAGRKFLLKCDANGNVLWSKNDKAWAHSIAVDASGNIYVTGKFSTITFRSGAIKESSENINDIFLMKCDANGTVLWAKGVVCKSYSDEVNSITVDAFGNAYIAGEFGSPDITFGATTLINDNSTGKTMNLFITKYDANGNVLWAKSTGNSSNAIANSLAVDASGNAYIVGCFEKSTINFGSIILTSPIKGYRSIFIAKLGNK